MRSCTKCGIAKPLTDFSADSCKPSGYGSHCKQCKKEAAAARRAADPEKYLEIARKYRRNNVDTVRSNLRKWQDANREKCQQASRRWKQENPEKVAAWVDSNRDAERAKVAKRRAVVSERTLGGYDEELRAYYKQALSLSNNTGIDYHVDHIVPLFGKTVSGLHVPWNLQVIPADENRKKSNKHMHDTLENLK